MSTRDEFDDLRAECQNGSRFVDELVRRMLKAQAAKSCATCEKWRLKTEKRRACCTVGMPVYQPAEFYCSLWAKRD